MLQIIPDKHVAACGLGRTLTLMVWRFRLLSALSSIQIQVTFDKGSQGQVAMVIYEWADAPYLGKKDSADEDDLVPVCSHVCSHVSLH